MLWERAEAGSRGLEEVSGKVWSLPEAAELHGTPSGWMGLGRGWDSPLTPSLTTGLKGTYQGLTATVLKQGSNQAIRFFVMTSLKNWYKGNASPYPRSATPAQPFMMGHDKKQGKGVLAVRGRRVLVLKHHLTCLLAAKPGGLLPELGFVTTSQPLFLSRG